MCIITTKHLHSTLARSRNFHFVEHIRSQECCGRAYRHTLTRSKIKNKRSLLFHMYLIIVCKVFVSLDFILCNDFWGAVNIVVALCIVNFLCVFRYTSLFCSVSLSSVCKSAFYVFGNFCFLMFHSLFVVFTLCRHVIFSMCVTIFGESKVAEDRSKVANCAPPTWDWLMKKKHLTFQTFHLYINNTDSTVA